MNKDIAAKIRQIKAEQERAKEIKDEEERKRIQDVHEDHKKNIRDILGERREKANK